MFLNVNMRSPIRLRLDCAAAQRLFGTSEFDRHVSEINNEKETTCRCLERGRVLTAMDADEETDFTRWDDQEHRLERGAIRRCM
jgi:hypothetical protein